MKAHHFSITLLFIVTGVMMTYFYFKSYFSGAEYYKTRVTQLEEEIKDHDLELAVSLYQLRQFQQDVAAVLPKQFKGKKASFAVRNLASVVSLPRLDQFQLRSGKALFQEGRKHFQKKDYTASNEKFMKLIERYPQSTKVVKAYFLWSEGLFLQGKYNKFIDTVDAMIRLFPEDELTGFALVRLGEVYRMQDRVDEAKELYKLVLSNYSNQALLKQARLHYGKAF